jgi:protein phosphatase 2C family protein 2/3
MGALTGSGFRVAGAGGLANIASMLGASNIMFRPAGAEDSDDDDEDEQMGNIKEVEDAKDVKGVCHLLIQREYS